MSFLLFLLFRVIDSVKFIFFKVNLKTLQLLIRTYYSPDEYWQSMEIAHKDVFQ